MLSLTSHTRRIAGCGFSSMPSRRKKTIHEPTTTKTTLPRPGDSDSDGNVATSTLSVSLAATLFVVHVPLWEALGRLQRKPTSPISRRPLVLQRHLLDNGRRW